MESDERTVEMFLRNDNRLGYTPLRSIYRRCFFEILKRKLSGRMSTSSSIWRSKEERCRAYFLDDLEEQQRPVFDRLQNEPLQMNAGYIYRRRVLGFYHPPFNSLGLALPSTCLILSAAGRFSGMVPPISFIVWRTFLPTSKWV